MFPSLSTLLSFYHERVLNFRNAFSACTEMIVGFCPLFYFSFICDLPSVFLVLSYFCLKNCLQQFFLAVFCWVYILLDFIYLTMSSSPSFLMDIFLVDIEFWVGSPSFSTGSNHKSAVIRIISPLWVIHCFSPATLTFFSLSFDYVFLGIYLQVCPACICLPLHICKFVYFANMASFICFLSVAHVG